MIPIFSNSLGRGELEAVERVFKSRWIGFGKESELFEKEFGLKIGSDKVLVFDSCTAALFTSVKILGIKKGDEVIIPTVNFIGAVNAVLDAGARPVFADVDPRYLNILPEEIKRLRNKNTRAVFLLHYGGHPCDMDAIYKNAEGLYIIEDSANSILSIYKGRNCGLLGEVGCFSFDAMKILCTGNGGAIALRDEGLYRKAIEFRYLGMKSKRQSGANSFKEKQQRWWEIELSCISNRYIPCDILSAIGREQLKKVDGFINKRRQIWQIYQKELSDLEWLKIPPEPLPDTESSYYMYWINAGRFRDALAGHLVENGIYCTFRYFPLHLVRYYGCDVHLPNSERLNEEILNIPLHQNLSQVDVEKIIRTVKEFKP